MIDYDYIDLFRQDSIYKNFHIDSSDDTIHLTNADIVGESFELTETLSSSGNISYGATEPACVKFTIRNTVPKLYKKWITISIEMDYADEPFVVGTYRVWNEKPSSDRSTRDITAYDVLYNIMHKTYKKWYNSLWENTDTMTLKQFRDAWFARLAQTHSHISQETAILANDDIIIKRSKKISKPTGRDIFNAICEINGVFGHIGRDEVFHYIKLKKTSPVAISNNQVIKIDYEDFSTVEVDRAEILDSEGNVLNYWGETLDNSENTYTVESNFLLKFLGSDNDGATTAGVMAHLLLPVLQDTCYTPIEADVKGNPCYEVGDYISFTSHGNVINTYILERTLKGVQSLRDVYYAECGNGEYFANNYDNNSNTYSGKIKELERQTSELEDNMGGGGYIVAALNAGEMITYTLIREDEYE
jgi:hypothetical protein